MNGGSGDFTENFTRVPYAILMSLVARFTVSKERNALCSCDSAIHEAKGTTDVYFVLHHTRIRSENVSQPTPQD
jgi:hypothetical protein